MMRLTIKNNKKKIKIVFYGVVFFALILIPIHHILANISYKDMKNGADVSDNRLRILATAGNAEAQYNLAKKYLSMDDVTPEIAERAMSLLDDAADNDNKDAIYDAWYYFANGFYGVQSNQKATTYARKIMNMNEANIEIGKWLMYASGEIIPNQSNKMSFSKDKTLEGNAVIQYWIGDAYFTGAHINKNLSEAKKWFEKAAIKGNADAEYKLGAMYFIGKGVEQDLDKANRLLTKSAKSGNILAKKALSKSN